jgi:hypothetical protein
MRPSFALVLAALLPACSGSAPDASDPSGDPGKGDIVSPVSQSDQKACAVTFRWLQKDAYANRAGRTSELWPPHTTTVLEVACKNMEPYSKFRENHGTLPSAVDASGTPILVEVKRSGPFYGTMARTRELVAAYEGCECAPNSEFFSTDGVNQDKAQALLGALGLYVQEHLRCPDADVEQLSNYLASGAFDQMLDAVASCAWDTGESWGDGFETATRDVLGDDFAKYHVCNNDAELEADLFERFTKGATLGSCVDSPLCHGPKWFYTP